MLQTLAIASTNRMTMAAKQKHDSKQKDENEIKWKKGSTQCEWTRLLL